MPFRFRKPLRRRRTRRPAATRPRGTFRKKVLSVVKSQSEMKHAFKPISITTTSNINATAGVYSIEPDIAQGDATYTRDGNKIRLHKVEIVGYINWKPNPYSTEHNANNAVYNCNNIVRAMILRQRSAGSGTGVATNVPTGVFEYNNLLENSNAYVGSLQNSLTDINKDAFIVKKDARIKMSGSMTQGPAGVWSIDSSSTMLKKFKYTLTFGKAGKVLTYRTGGAITSTNFPYFMAVAAHNAFDGTVPVDLFLDCQSKWYYTDA